MKTREILVVALVVIGGACSATEPLSQVDLTVSEWSIDSSGTAIASGPVSIDVDNVGEFPHTVVVSTRSGEVISASDVIPAGESGSFSIDLEPGAYEFNCRIVAEFEGELLDHYQLGMLRTFTVEG